jgi:prevent-host-death family protein
MPEPKQIGIREFRDHATRVIREVREERQAYVITVDGEPAALLEPLRPQRDIEAWRQEARVWLAGMDELADEIATRGPPVMDAVEAVRRQRREL